jgi:casein kinase 1
MLVYFLNGELPWQGLAFEHKFEKDHMIMDSKLKITPAQLCNGLPAEIAGVFEYIKSLDFYEDPDYRFIISELTYIFEDKCDLIDLEYDWEKLPSCARLEKTNIEISFP